MLKRLVLKYWPMALLVILILTVLCMSRYAENRKTENQENAQTGSPKASIPPSDASKGNQKANEPQHPPSWIETFAWPDGVTAWALFLTLFVIAWQSTETRDAAKSANAQIQVMKDKERSRLSVLPTDPHIPPWSPMGGDGNIAVEVSVCIINDGDTKAFNVKAIGYFTVSPKEGKWKIDAKSGEELEVPTVIRKADPERPISVSLAPSGTMKFFSLTPHQIQDVRDEKRVFIIAGTVFYEDVFGDPHQTPFQYVWQIYGNDSGIGDWRDGSYWIDLSPASS